MIEEWKKAIDARVEGMSDKDLRLSWEVWSRMRNRDHVLRDPKLAYAYEKQRSEAKKRGILE